MSKLKDLTGQRFGRLTVIERAKNDKRGNAQWLCKCDCGNETIVNATKLKKDGTKSCGCLQPEVVSKKMKMHGKTNTRLFKIWASMKERCYLKSIHNYNDYGGRGIKVCEEWQEFEPFYQWAKANGYKDSLSIDRINVNGNYEPFNCRWATAKEQANNRRNNKLITYKSQTLTQCEWERLLNFPLGTISRRLKAGWDLDKIMTTEVKRYKNAKR